MCGCVPCRARPQPHPNGPACTARRGRFCLRSPVARGCPWSIDVDTSEHPHVLAVVCVREQSLLPVRRPLRSPLTAATLAGELTPQRLVELLLHAESRCGDQIRQLERVGLEIEELLEVDVLKVPIAHIGVFGIGEIVSLVDDAQADEGVVCHVGLRDGKIEALVQAARAPRIVDALASARWLVRRVLLEGEVLHQHCASIYDAALLSRLQHGRERLAVEGLRAGRQHSAGQLEDCRHHIDHCHHLRYASASGNPRPTDGERHPNGMLVHLVLPLHDPELAEVPPVVRAYHEECVLDHASSLQRLVHAVQHVVR
mmetsp:Transcript_83910/g.251477  ORF Transcript_83910/g.251477 Transcript_83910/m.251477 type:complete len:314 (+) Transcript_83910:138-1079(+)